MNIGVPKERRIFEFRVGLTPIATQMLVEQGHTCYIEHNAGIGAGFTDQDYIAAGGKISYSAHEVFGRADLVAKVARPLFEELEWLRPRTVVAGLLHLGSARKDKTNIMREKQITAIAYEQIQLEDGSVPVRRPLSQIGGLLAAQIAAQLMQSPDGGRGVLMGGVPGVPPAEVVVIGAGVAGSAAISSFLGMGAHVTVLDIDLNVLSAIYERFPSVVTMISYPSNIALACSFADVIVGAVLVPNLAPPIVLTRDMLRMMKQRAIAMDISIDEGGCFETSRPTTHEHPTYVEEGVIHYCVPNIPSLVARTSTNAFLNSAFPYILELANKGVDRAATENTAIQHSIVIHHGEPRNISRLTPKGMME